MTRIAFIGAGSVEFTKNLLGDLLTFPELADATIALHDIDPERLDTAEAMARWTSDALGAGATIEAHLDRRAAIDGCDHVINMIQVGGHAATLIDFEIPKRFGLRQTIGDTLGVGGIFRALRTIPVMLDIAADMAELCPDALAAQLHEPDGHAVLGDLRRLADPPGRRAVPLGAVDDARPGRDRRRARTRRSTYLGAGVNHQAWILRFAPRRPDLYPLLDEAIERRPGAAAAGARRDVPRGSGTSRPSRASTRPSTCRGSCEATR